MSVKFNNRAKFARSKGDYNYYDWEVFVDEPKEVIDQIDYVTYFLHKTFPEPVRTVVDPQKDFSLNSRGWGEFDIGIKVTFKDGSEEQETYSLDLSKSWDGKIVD